MRLIDRPIFLDAARHFEAWILVRQTNPRSLEYIGLPKYIPKPIDCKAKTADKDNLEKKVAGLVVDPAIHFAAFNKVEKASEAKEQWFRMGTLIGTTYKVDLDKNSRHYGCLQLNGCWLHGDYDLYDIVEVSRPRGNLAAVETLNGQPHMRGYLFLSLQEFVNRRIGSPMLQHGGEAQYKSHSEQTIDVFSPNGEFLTLPNKAAIEALYAGEFQGRRTLG